MAKLFLLVALALAGGCDEGRAASSGAPANVRELHGADSPITEWRDAEHHVTCWTRVGDYHGEVAISCLRDVERADGGL